MAKTSRTTIINDNPLLQLLSLLVKQDPPEPYIVLVQQSSCYSFATRQIAASKDKDVAVYERAAVKTPSQRAQFDLQPWMPKLLTLVVSLQTNTMKQKQQQRQPKKTVIWLETIGARLDTILRRHEHVTIISTAQNPLGWDDNDESNATATPSIGNLEGLVLKLEEVEASMILIESLTPLFMFHGVHVTLQFLQRLKVPVMVPVERSFLSKVQHITLEDAAQAVLMVEGGEATLIRRGVRERSNVLREQVPFILNDTNGLKLLSSNETSTFKEDVKTKTTVDSSWAVGSNETVDPLQPTPPLPSTTSTGKVILRHEEDDGPPIPLSRPKIYLQDDDPEFDDMDEEDPDDDLDI